MMQARMTSNSHGEIFACFLFLAGYLASASPLPAAEPLSRGQLARAVNVEGLVTDPQLRQQTGWETVRAFSWRIEIEQPPDSGAFAPTDAGRTFHHGQRFRLRIEAYCDLCIYVLVRNADGSEVVLLPERNEQAPRIAKAQSIVLPADGSSFRFDPPAGREQLRLVASPSELTWIASRELFLVQNGQELNPQQRTTLERFRANRTRSIEAAQTRQEKLPQLKSLSEAVQAIGQGSLSKGCEVIAVEPSPQGNLVLATSGDRRSQAVIVHDISLKHQ